MLKVLVVLSYFAALVLMGPPMPAMADATNEWSVNYTFSGTGSQWYFTGGGGAQSVAAQATPLAPTINIADYPSIGQLYQGPFDSTYNTTNGLTTASNHITLNSAMNSGSIISTAVVKRSPSEYFESGSASFYTNFAYKPDPHPATFMLDLTGSTRSLTSNGDSYGSGMSELRIWAWSLNPYWNLTPNDRSDDTLWWSDTNNDGIAEGIPSPTTLYLVNSVNVNWYNKGTPLSDSGDLNRTFTFNVPSDYYAADPNFFIQGGFSVWASANEHDPDFTPPNATVPEPATMLLLGSGLIGLAGYGRKKFFKK